MAIDVAAARPDLIVVTYTAEPSDAEFDAYLVEMDRRLAARRRTAVLIDSSAISQVSRAQAQQQGAWMQRNRATLAQYTVALAFVITKPSHRFILSTIFMVQKPPSPYLVTASRDEAMAFCRSRLHGSPSDAPAATK